MPEQGQPGQNVSRDLDSQETPPQTHHPSVRGHGVGPNDLSGHGIRGTR